MQWQDEGIILGYFPLGETSVRLIVLTQDHGLRAGYFRLQKNHHLFPGDRASVRWQARLEEHLGRFSVEVTASIYARHMYHPQRSLLLLSACDLLIKTLTENTHHQPVYKVLVNFLENDLLSDDFLNHYIYFELFILKELGFELDLYTCVRTGSKTDLAYVSPTSGKAVSRGAVGEYRDKLLILPSFLAQGEFTQHTSELLQALQLTGYFFEKHILHRQTLPHRRKLLINSLNAIKAA